MGEGWSLQRQMLVRSKYHRETWEKRAGCWVTCTPYLKVGYNPLFGLPFRRYKFWRGCGRMPYSYEIAHITKRKRAFLRGGTLSDHAVHARSYTACRPPLHRVRPAKSSTRLSAPYRFLSNSLRTADAAYKYDVSTRKYYPMIKIQEGNYLRCLRH